MAPKPRLSPQQIERLRDLAWRLLKEKYGTNRSRMAADLGVSQPSLSRFLSKKQGIAEPLALKLLVLSGADPEEFDMEPPASTVRKTIDANPAWTDTVRAARALYPRQPEWTWTAAGRVVFPDLDALTPDVALHLAMAAELAKQAS